jgi:hypothetical protein
MTTLNSDAELIQKLAALLEEANLQPPLEASSVGACLISTPGNPRPTCVQVTREQCNAVKGVFVGGKCP